MVAALNAELEWQLAADRQQSYVAALLHCGALPSGAAEVRRLTIIFHQDHALVEALRDRAHPQHEATWAQWCIQALRILRHHGLGAPDEALGDLHDVAQVALEELVRALPSFRYASRFSTWAYTVISHSAQRYQRNIHAAKRSGPTESIERQAAQQVSARAAEQPEVQAEGRELATLIDAILADQPDSRWVTIFRLWAHEDKRLADIAKHLGMSASRVSVLLDQIVSVLCQHPAIQAWLNADLAADQARAREVGPPQTK